MTNTILNAPICSCGKVMEPDFVNISTFDKAQYLIEWYCHKHKEKQND